MGVIIANSRGIELGIPRSHLVGPRSLVLEQWVALTREFRRISVLSVVVHRSDGMGDGVVTC